MTTVGKLSATDEETWDDCENDQLLVRLLKLMKGERLKDIVQQRKFEKLAQYFHLDGKNLLHEGKLSVPRTSVSDVLQMSHDCKVAGNFGYFKTLSILNKFYWKNNSRDVKMYVQGFSTCQQKKNRQRKKLADPTSLKVPTRRWSSLATDFIVSQPKTNNGFNSIITWADLLSRRVHFIPSKESNKAFAAANAFCSNIFKLHGIPDNIVSDRDAFLTSKLWKSLMKLCLIQLNMSTRRHLQTDSSS